MNEIKDILNFAGWGGVAFFLLWKFGPKWLRRGKDDSDDIETKVKNMVDLMPIIQAHLRDSTQRVVDLETLKKDNSLNNEFMKENIREVKDDIKSLFKLVSDIKNMMIKNGN